MYKGSVFFIVNTYSGFPKNKKNFFAQQGKCKSAYH